VLDLITVTNITAIDLNLLLVLHAVLEEESATRAARKLHVTQSAVSNALARLRELLHDPLFVRHSRGLAATPHARALRPQLAELVRQASAVFEPPARFDPRKSTREFRIACVDYCNVIVLPRLFELLSARAPGCSLRMITLERLIEGGGLARDVDLHLGMPPNIPNGCLAAPLFQDEFVCLMRRDGKRRPQRLSLHEYTSASHVRVSVLDNAHDLIDQLLVEHGVTRSIALTVPHFSVVPFVVARTGCIASLSRRLAEAYDNDSRLLLRTPPIEMHPRALQMIWHTRTEADEGARFLRALVSEATAADLPKARRKLRSS
jgi:DNA-binding transcriptional LysR family regulator